MNKDCIVTYLEASLYCNARTCETCNDLYGYLECPLRCEENIKAIKELYEFVKFKTPKTTVDLNPEEIMSLFD